MKCARRNLDRVYVFEITFVEVLHLVEKHPSGIERDAAFDSFANGARLLVISLSIEMFGSRPFPLEWVPGNALPFRLDLIPVKVCDADSVPGHDGNFTVAEKENIARVLPELRTSEATKNSRRRSDDHRRTQPRRDDCV